MHNQKYPEVGLGVIIINKEGKVLIGKRKGGLAPKYSLPGGHLELGETFEHGAIREIKEETNLDILNPKVVGVGNNLDTYKEEGRHDVSVFLLVTEFSGELRVMEPNKCAGWNWEDTKNLPQPHFDASSLGIACYLKNSVYEGIK